MKKRILTFLIILSLLVVYVPTITQAAITPHFVMVNETLLPFNEDTMPMLVRGEIFIPVGVLRALEIWSVGNEEDERVRVWRGVRYVDFYTRSGETRAVDQDGVDLGWPAARRIGRRFYIPLHQICEFFGLSYQSLAIPSDIISERHMSVVRIVSGSLINGPSAIGMNRTEIRDAFIEYFATPAQSPTPQPPPPIVEDTPPPPVEEQPPDYSDVTIYLSFYDISAGGAPIILDLLDIRAESGLYASFFVCSADIMYNPGLVRRMVGTGHTIGIWLNEGSFEEYLYVSALLFEAAKVRTVIVSASEASEMARETANAHGLIFWETENSLIDHSSRSFQAITSAIPRGTGDRMNLMFSSSEEGASMLMPVYSFLREYLFNIGRITETVPPISN